MLSREPWTGLKSGPTWTKWGSIRTGARCVTLGSGQLQIGVQTGERTHCEQPCKEQLGGPDGQNDESEAVFALATWEVNCILGCIKRGVAEEWGRACSPLLCPCLNTSWVLYPGLGLGEEGCGTVRASLEGHKNNQRSGTPFLRRKVERAGLSNSGK